MATVMIKGRYINVDRIDFSGVDPDLVRELRRHEPSEVLAALTSILNEACNDLKIDIDRTNEPREKAFLHEFRDRNYDTLRETLSGLDTYDPGSIDVNLAAQEDLRIRRCMAL